MGTWEREDSRITLGFLVPVTLWPMVPYLETQNILEDTGLEQRKGESWRWAGKGNGALFSSRHVEIEVPIGQPMKCPILMGPEVWSSEERSMAMDTDLEWEKTSQKKQEMSWETKNDLERARWTGRGRDSGGRHCLHKDPGLGEVASVLSGLHSEDNEENGDSCKMQRTHLGLLLLWVPRRAGRERTWPVHKGSSHSN